MIPRWGILGAAAASGITYSLLAVLLVADYRARNRGVGLRVAMPAVGRLRDPQRLAQRRFELVGQLVDPRLQPLVLVHQRLADQHAGHPRVLLGERQQHDDRLLGLFASASQFAIGGNDHPGRLGWNRNSGIEHVSLVRRSEHHFAVGVQIEISGARVEKVAVGILHAEKAVAFDREIERIVRGLK